MRIDEHAASELYDAVAGLLGWWDREDNTVPPHDMEDPQKYIDAMRIALRKASGESEKGDTMKPDAKLRRKFLLEILDREENYDLH